MKEGNGAVYQTLISFWSGSVHLLSQFSLVAVAVCFPFSSGEVLLDGRAGWTAKMKSKRSLAYFSVFLRDDPNSNNGQTPATKERRLARCKTRLSRRRLAGTSVWAGYSIPLALPVFSRRLCVSSASRVGHIPCPPKVANEQ